MAKYFSCAGTAKLIRQSLKEAFPGVKFSVRSSTYSGGASISVSWTDGPNAAQVESITRGFKASYFDGSIDYQGSIHHMMDGEQVTFGADYITSTRIHSDAAVERAMCQPPLRRQLLKRRNRGADRPAIPFRPAL
jgi:Large polyvalent protein associated domain 29